MRSHTVNTETRGRALRGVVVAALAIGVLLFAVNMRLHAFGLAAVNAGMVLVCVALLGAIRRGAPFRGLALLYVAVVTANMTATLAAPQIQPGASSSLALIPVVCYLLLDARWALLAGVSAFIVALGGYFGGAVADPVRLNPRHVAHVIVPVVILFVLCHVLARHRASDMERFLESTARDPLTGLGNRERLMNEYAIQQYGLSEENPLSVMLVDLDGFKDINDRFGHDAGDAALVFFGRLLRRRLRSSDVACRIGGDEFAVLLPGTRLAGAIKVADDMRRTLETTAYRYGSQDISMTLSAGVAEAGRDGDEWVELYRIADARLYDSKRRGRNRVCFNAEAEQAAIREI